MKIHLQIILLFLISSLFLSCGKKDGFSKSSTNIIQTESMIESKVKLDVSDSRCMEKNNCSPSVGLLVAASEKYVETCTAFLITDDVVATNAHCIPKDLRDLKEECNDRITLDFPETNTYPREIVKCSQVLEVSKITNRFKGNADFAFIKLARKIRRPILEISQKGFDADSYEDFSIIKMEPHNMESGLPGGFQQEETCRYTPNSMLSSDKSTSPFRAIVVMADCIVVSGNSGSPIVDSEGKVRGITYATFNYKKLEDYADSIENKNSQNDFFFIDDPASSYSLVTNFSCLKSKTLNNNQLPRSCNVEEKKMSQNDDLASRFEGYMQSLVDGKATELDRRFKWKSSSVILKQGGSSAFDPIFFFSTPACIQKDGAKIKDSEKINYKLWIVAQGINSDFQQSIRRMDDHLPKTQDLKKDFTMKYHFESDKGSHMIDITSKDGKNILSVEVDEKC